MTDGWMGRKKKGSDVVGREYRRAYNERKGKGRGRVKGGRRQLLVTPEV